MIELGLYEAQKIIMETIIAYKDKLYGLQNKINKLKSDFGKKLLGDYHTLFFILYDKKIKEHLFENLDDAGYNCLLEMCGKLNEYYELGTGIKDAVFNRNTASFRIESSFRDRKNINIQTINKNNKVIYKIKPADGTYIKQDDYVVQWNLKNDRFIKKTFNSVKNKFDSDSWDREYSFDENGEFEISATIRNKKKKDEEYKVKWVQRVGISSEHDQNYQDKAEEIGEVWAQYVKNDETLTFYSKKPNEEYDANTNIVLLRVDALSKVKDREYPTREGNDGDLEYMETAGAVKKIYVPIEFPPGDYNIIKNGFIKSENKEYGPYKIKTDAKPMVDVWAYTDENGKRYYTETEEQVQDDCYWIHGGGWSKDKVDNEAGNNNYKDWTLGCIRVKNIDILRIVSMFDTYNKSKSIKLKVE